MSVAQSQKGPYRSGFGCRTSIRLVLYGTVPASTRCSTCHEGGSQDEGVVSVTLTSAVVTSKKLW